MTDNGGGGFWAEDKANENGGRKTGGFVSWAFGFGFDFDFDFDVDVDCSLAWQPLSSSCPAIVCRSLHTWTRYPCSALVSSLSRRFHGISGQHRHLLQYSYWRKKKVQGKAQAQAQVHKFVRGHEHEQKVALVRKALADHSRLVSDMSYVPPNAALTPLQYLFYAEPPITYHCFVRYLL